MAKIEDYVIKIPDSKIELLKTKIDLTTWPDELDDSEWGYGAPLTDVKRLAKYWQEQYDWKKAEARINQLPNFKISLQVESFEPLDIHFLHQKSNVEGAIPLLFSHGCNFPYMFSRIGAG